MLSASVGLAVGVIVAASVGQVIRNIRQSFRPVPVRHFMPDECAGIAVDLRRAVTVGPPNDHGQVTVTDARGREWVMPAGHAPCGVCDSVGGHLPDCPAGES